MKRLYDKALIDEMAKKFGHEKAYLSDFSQALLDIIREGLIRDGVVRLHQFGTFKLKWMQTRNGVHPGTGEKMVIQGRPRVIFTPAKGLKDIIEPDPPQLLPIDSVETTSAEVSSQQQSSQENITITLKSEEPLKAESVAQELLAEKVERDSLESIEPETSSDEVVADIQDEIEVLEQVVDILKSEPHEEDNLEDSSKSFNQPDEKETALNDVVNEAVTETTSNEPVQEFDQQESDLKDPQQDSTDASQWVDKPVLDQIEQIAEMQYFKAGANNATDSTYQIKENIGTADAVADTSQSDITATSFNNAGTSNDELDYDLTGEQADDKTITEEKKKPLLAIAAAVFVILAAGLFINNLSDQTNDALLTQTDDGIKYLYSYNVEHETVVIKPQITDVTDNESVVEEVPVQEQKIVAVEAPEEVLETEQQIVEETAADDKDQIIVSTEQYNQLERARAEESVFFAERDYKLLNGDSLWRLARSHYVNPFYWPHIYQANHKKINNPDKVKIGKVILLPTLYGDPKNLTRRDKRNIAMGYYFNYLYHKQKGNPYAYFSLIGVDKFDANLLIEFQEEISRSDVNNLAMLME